MESNAAELPVHHRLLAWLDTHKKETGVGAAVVVVAVLGVGFFIWRSNARQANANGALAQISARSFGNSEEASTSQALLQVAADHPNTEAGARAILLAGGTLFAEGKFTEAKAQFDRFLRDFRDSPFAPQAVFGIAASYDALGETNQAITAYTDIVQHHSSDNVAAQARLALARIYQNQGQWQQAVDLYEEILRASSPAMVSREGSIAWEARLRLQELIARHPRSASISGSTNAPALNLQEH